MTQKVTSDTNECFADRFFNGFNRISIPLFQRPYAWKALQFERFREDIENAMDNEDRARFIGTVVAIRRNSGINDPVEFEVVDGQQRLVTIYLTVLAATVVYAENNKPEQAGNLARRYLFHPDVNTANTKLYTSRLDSKIFQDLWTEVLQNPNLERALGGTRPRPPNAVQTPNPHPQLRQQFQRIKRWLAGIFREEPAKLESVVNAVLTRLSMVYLELQDPTSAPTIFEGLNNGGIKTTVGDLVRNEIFSRLRSDPIRAQQIFDGEWKEFETSLRLDFNDFFFPYGLILDRQVNKGDLFSALRSRWNGVEVSQIIKEMGSYVPSFRAIAHGEPPDWADKNLSAAVKRFSQMGCVPSSVRPFVMQLIHATRDDEKYRSVAVEVLEVVESFLVRRAICGFEPTGLHAVFKGLWDQTYKELSAHTVAARIRSHRTVQWPNDEVLSQAIAERDLYGTNVIRYLTSEYDRHLGGDVPLDVPQIEHIMPQTTKDTEWSSVSQEFHKQWKNRWANLIVCHAPLNGSVGNSSYGEKRNRFVEDSMFKSPRYIADKFSTWDQQALEQRTVELQSFAVKRWRPYSE